MNPLLSLVLLAVHHPGRVIVDSGDTRRSMSALECSDGCKQSRIDAVFLAGRLESISMSDKTPPKYLSSGCGAS